LSLPKIAEVRGVVDLFKHPLTDDQRQVMELTHFEGLTQTEIAGQLKKPLGTVKGLVRSALKSLRAALGLRYVIWERLQQLTSNTTIKRPFIGWPCYNSMVWNGASQAN
jgi:DNA-binding NarL/FixJ family response regulator